MIDRIPNPPAGMLRRGSPVFVGTAQDLVQCASVASGVLLVGEDDWRDDPCGIALDLTDATGRAHLAAWIRGQGYTLILPAARHLGLSGNERERLFDQARNLEDMTPPQIDTLARLALRVMGRTE